MPTLVHRVDLPRRLSGNTSGASETILFDDDSTTLCDTKHVVRHEVLQLDESESSVTILYDDSVDLVDITNENLNGTSCGRDGNALNPESPITSKGGQVLMYQNESCDDESSFTNHTQDNFISGFRKKEPASDFCFGTSSSSKAPTIEVTEAKDLWRGGLDISSIWLDQSTVRLKHGKLGKVSSHVAESFASTLTGKSCDDQLSLSERNIFEPREERKSPTRQENDNVLSFQSEMRHSSPENHYGSRSTYMSSGIRFGDGKNTSLMMTPIHNRSCDSMSVDGSDGYAYSTDKSEVLLSCTSLRKASWNTGTLFASPGFASTTSIDESVELVRAAEGDLSPQSITIESPELLRPYTQRSPINANCMVSTHQPRRELDKEWILPTIAKSKSDLQMIVLSPMQSLLNSQHMPSPKEFFWASQSPISPRLTYDSSNSGETSDEESFGINIERGKGTENTCPDDTIDSFDSVDQTGRVLSPISTNLTLKKGAKVHFDKQIIPLRRGENHNTAQNFNMKSLQQSIHFPDPLVKYSKRQKQILGNIFHSIRRSEREPKAAAAVFFSMPKENIVDVILKLLLNDRSGHPYKKGDYQLQGKTVIIVRTKDDTTKWESALRGGTGCSVFNHATTPASERMRASMAEKATLFDVIITTYDALKSPDVAIAVDDHGRAILSYAATKEGWFSSRRACQSTGSSGPQKCVKLSTLHRIHFDRIVYIDILGRKSYIAKGGTARASSAAALRGKSRLVFFGRTDNDGIAGIFALRKSDRRAVASLSAVLHLNPPVTQEGNEDPEDFLERCAVDLHGLL